MSLSRGLVLFLLINFTWGCFGQAPAPESPKPPQPASQSQPADPPDYVLQRGDDLLIRAYNLPQLEGELRIRPDGKISVLLLNDVQAAGLTAAQLGLILSDGYTKHFRNPRLTVIVRSIAAQSVFVGGDVSVPSAVPVRGPLSAVQAVTAAGGVKDPTSDEVVILRNNGQGEARSESVSVREVVSGQRTDPIVNPSDTIYVQKSTISVYVGGEVGRPGLIPLNGGMTILAAIFQAGGFRPTAKTKSVVLVRDSGKGGPVATMVTLNNLFLDTPHTQLKPFDVVYVPKSRIAKLNQWVDQYIRQMSPATLSVGFSYLFGQSFGSTQQTPF